MSKTLQKGLTIVIGLALGLAAAGTATAKVTLVEKVGDKETKLAIYGFGQLEGRGGDGMSSEGGLFFQAQRLRIGLNYYYGNMFSKLFLDFNQSHSADDAGLPKMIKDAFVGYRWSDAAFVRLGMIKTPIGMAFCEPGWNLDIVERAGLDKNMVLERDFGLLLSGRLIGQENFTDKPIHTDGTEMGNERQGYGFGYDIGVFNPAGRSGAVTWNKSQLGDALAYAGRVSFDHGPQLHVEASYGLSEKAGGTATSQDYSVMGVAIGSENFASNYEVKAEYIAGKNILGIKDLKQRTWSILFGYMVHPQIELLAKHYQSSAIRDDNPNVADTDLGNTYVGFAYYIDPITKKHRDLQRHRIMFNYIIASGDTDTWTGKWGYKKDGWVLQWQYKF